MLMVTQLFLLIGAVSSVPFKLTLSDIIKVREQFMRETLSKPKFSEMRVTMERRSRAPPRIRDQPRNPELDKRVKELEESAKMDQKLRDLVVGPNLEETNRPIFDMLHQGDMLLNNVQMRAVQRAERSIEINEQLQDGTVFGKKRIMAKDPPFFPQRRSKRQILSATKYGFPKTKWETDKPISYYFEMDIDDKLKEKIRAAVQFWQDNTCLSFKENGTIEPKIRYFRGAGCFSSVGKQFEDFEQDISLGNGCELTGHSLGLFHHQSRFDRDQFIDLVTANIPTQWMSQYDKWGREVATTLDLNYDYGSDLHYPGYDQRSSKVMLAAKKKPYQHTMGNRRQPTFLDLKLVNEFYGCPAKCPTHPKCINGGFVNPNNCKVCICPTGFAGDLCNKRASGAFGAPDSCGQDIQATSNWKTLEGEVTAKGSLDNAGMTLRQAECHYHIKAPIGQQIEIRVESIKGQCTNECYYGATEIKFENFQMTGARLCCPGHIRDIGGNLKTTTGMAVVSAYSQKDTQKFKIRYRAVQSKQSEENGSGNEPDSQSTNTTTILPSITGIEKLTQPTLEPFEPLAQNTTIDPMDSTTSLNGIDTTTSLNGSGTEPSSLDTTTILSTTNGIDTTTSLSNGSGIDPIDTTTILSTTTQSTSSITSLLTTQSSTQTSITSAQISSTQGPQTTTENSNCRDIAINCQFQLQYCRSAVAAMQIYCKRSCQFCDK